MVEIIVLDAGPLGLLTHPRPSHEIVIWLARLVAAGKRICIPEIADYEVRRELLRAGRLKGLRRLDQYKANLEYLPITTEAMLRAADFWADVRKRGQPTGHQHSLDADAILAGQAATCTVKPIVIATTNVRHLNRFVSAKLWEDIR